MAKKSSQLAARGRGPGRPFRKGVSGNPRGKRKGTLSITTRVRATFSSGKAPGQIVAELKRLMKDPDARVRLATIREILDRADGRSPETVNLQGDVGLTMKDMGEIQGARRTLVWIRKRHTPAEVKDFLRFVGVST